MSNLSADTPPPSPPSIAFSLGHTETIRSVAWSPDGTRALSASDDYTLRLWDAHTGDCLAVWEGHTADVNSAAWSSDGTRALSASDDCTLRLWDAHTGSCLAAWQGHTNAVYNAAWSPDGTRALSASDDYTLRLWDVQTGDCLAVWEGHDNAVWSVAWSPDGTRALSASDDDTLRLWDAQTGDCLAVWAGHTDAVWNVAWSPDGTRALSASSDNTLRLWDAQTGDCLAAWEGHTSAVNSVAWSPDGTRALSASDDKSLRLWDAHTGACLAVWEGHTSGVNCAAWSPDGKRALSASDDKSLRLWDAHTGACLAVWKGHAKSVYRAAWSHNGWCALSASRDNTIRLWDAKNGACLAVWEGHTGDVLSVAWSPDGRRVLSASSDDTLRLWDAQTGACLAVWEGHTGFVLSAEWRSDEKRALSASFDKTLRLWDTQTGACLAVWEGHTGYIWSGEWSPDGRRVLSASSDKTVRLWDAETGTCLAVWEGHADIVTSAAWRPDGKRALSASNDKTLRLWDAETGACLAVWEGHTADVTSAAWSPDGRRVISGSFDKTLRVWDAENGTCLAVWKGHTREVRSVAWSPDGRHIFSAANNGVWRKWDVTALPDAPPLPEARYTNAKVLLVGESSAGKTSLTKRLALDVYEEKDSTVGAWATQWKLDGGSGDGIEREIWLWDFGGQPDQRLIHQFFMDETSLAILVFDGQKEDLFDTLGQWDRDLQRACSKPFVKLLVAGRVDAGGLRGSRERLKTFAEERSFRDILETSAKTGEGCEELKKAIEQNINWDSIPRRSSTKLFRALRQAILALKDEGHNLIRFDDLRGLLLDRIGTEHPFTDADLETVLGLLEGPGAVWKVKFGSWVLLQPELINAYAQAVTLAVRDDKFERGCIKEDRVLRGDLNYPKSITRLPEDVELILLRAMHDTLLTRQVCFRENTDEGTLLVFPSFYGRERPELTGNPSVHVTYRFNGFLDDIYATLVVRLHHLELIDKDELWRYAADFKTLSGKKLGVKMTRLGEGAGEIDLYFEPDIPLEERMIFSKYVHRHILDKAKDVVRLRRYVCPHCGTPVGNSDAPQRRLEDWKAAGGSPPKIPCVYCEKKFAIWDEMEKLFASPEVDREARDLQKETEIILDNESKERLLVAEIMSAAAAAGQIFREVTISDHGIDGEIEFKDDAFKATGKKICLQLKSGDSYLYERKRDGAEVFTIRKERHPEYWRNHDTPVFLAIRDSKGSTRWMEIRDYLERESEGGTKPVTQIIFDGEPFTAEAIRRVRDEVLAGRYKRST